MIRDQGRPILRICSDEIYERLLFDVLPTTALPLSPEWRSAP